MRKIITLAVTACMITGCVGLKPDELVKADIPDNTIKTSTDSPKGTQPKGQDQEQEQNKNQGEQENKKGFFDAWTMIYYAGRAACIIVTGAIVAAFIYKYYHNEKALLSITDEVYEICYNMGKVLGIIAPGAIISYVMKYCRNKLA